MHEAGTGAGGPVTGTRAVHNFANSAVGGQLSIDPDEAQNALAKIRGGKDTVQQLMSEIAALEERPQLGANPVGNAMSAKMATRAGGSYGSYAEALERLYSQFEKAEEGLAAAMENYRSTEHDVAQQFGRLS